jgi:transposase
VTAPTYEELAALVVALQTRIAEQDARIAELERQLAASSRNSSKPPSADGLDKPAPKSLRGRPGASPGAAGPGGSNAAPGRLPDEVVVHEPGACAGCGADLPVGDRPARVIRRQIFDIPTIEVRVVEHRLLSRRRSRGTLTTAAGPAGVSAPVAYGPHAAAIAVYLCLGKQAPVERTAALLAEVFGIPMWAGTVAA